MKPAIPLTIGARLAIGTACHRRGRGFATACVGNATAGDPRTRGIHVTCSAYIELDPAATRGAGIR